MNFVHRSVVEGIAEVRIEREKVNALEDSLVTELAACFAALAEDPDVRGSILTGTGRSSRTRSRSSRRSTDTRWQAAACWPPRATSGSW